MIDNPVPRILVAEDESIVAMQIARSLRRLGYSVCSAASGEDAIRLAKEEKPDLALMDIMLEGDMDGIEAAGYLTRYYGIPVVYLTANGDESTVNRAKLTQPDGYILKPFQEARLRNTIDLVLHRRALANRVKYDAAAEPVPGGPGDAVFAADASLRMVYLNSSAESLIGMPLDEVRGLDLVKLFRGWHDDQIEMLRAAAMQAMATGITTDLSRRGMKLPAKGVPTHAAHSLVPAGPAAKDITGVVLMFRDLALLRRGALSGNLTDNATRQHREGSVVGPGATGLPRRAAAEQALEASRLHGPHRFAVAFLIDRYEQIEKRFGPDAADEVLVFYSGHFANAIGPADLLFQWGGPSFLMLLDRRTTAAEVRCEIMSWADARMEKMIDLASRSTLLLVSGRRRLFEAIDATPTEDLIREIDEFTAPGGMAPGY